MCAKQSTQPDAHCPVSQEAMVLLIDLQIYKQLKQKKVRDQKIRKLSDHVDHLENTLIHHLTN